MKTCIVCGEKTRNERSYLCQECFDEAFSKQINEEVKS